jgi:hypothetical protein
VCRGKEKVLTDTISEGERFGMDKLEALSLLDTFNRGFAKYCHYKIPLAGIRCSSNPINDTKVSITLKHTENI